jgi:chromosome partitioning protein
VTKATSGDNAAPKRSIPPPARGAAVQQKHSARTVPRAPKAPKVPKPPEIPGVARIVAIANQKGGVGKSTTAVSLGAALAELGFRILVVDLDPQGNASTGLGIRHEARDTSVYDVLVSEAPVVDAIVHTMVEGLHAVPSTIDLAGAEIELVSQFSRETRLKKALGVIREGVYDFMLLDCPPSLGLLTVNALTAAEELIVPIQCEYYALEGLGQLLRNVSLVQQNINPELRLSGIVMTMFDPRTKLSEQVVAEVQRFFGEVVYDVIIPRTVRLSEAPGYGQPITIYDTKSRGAECYRELAREVALRPPPSEPMPVFNDLPTVVVPTMSDNLTPRRPLEDSDVPTPTVHDVMSAVTSHSAAETEQAQKEQEVEAPRVEAAEVEVAPEVEAPEVEAPEVEAPEVEAPEVEAQVWLEELAAESGTPDSAEFLSEAVAEVVQRLDDADLWDESEEPSEPGSRVSAPRSPAPPGELPQRRVVVIDEGAVDRPQAQQPEGPPEAETETETAVADIGATLQDEEQPRRRRWRRFSKGGE